MENIERLISLARKQGGDLYHRDFAVLLEPTKQGVIDVTISGGMARAAFALPDGQILHVRLAEIPKTHFEQWPVVFVFYESGSSRVILYQKNKKHE